MSIFTLRNPSAGLYYQDLPGTAPPILFIHGLGCASSCDYPQTAASPALTPHRRILVDLLGSGYSDKPEDASYTITFHAKYLAGFLEHMDLTDVILFGHSMGGAVAIELAELCRDRIGTLILSESNLDPGGGFFSRKVAAFGEEKYVGNAHEGMIRSSRKAGGLHWAATMVSNLPRAVFREAQSLIDGSVPGWREMLYGLSCPRTFIFGEQSLPDPDCEKLVEAGVNIEIIPGTGHGMAWDAPEGLATAMRRGIDRML